MGIRSRLKCNPICAWPDNTVLTSARAEEREGLRGPTPMYKYLMGEQGKAMGTH